LLAFFELISPSAFTVRPCFLNVCPAEATGLGQWIEANVGGLCYENWNTNKKQGVYQEPFVVSGSWVFFICNFLSHSSSTKCLAFLNDRNELKNVIVE
jgi:hypothetical protein